MVPATEIQELNGLTCTVIRVRTAGTAASRKIIKFIGTHSWGMLRHLFQERSVQMKLVESILTKNPCYTAGRKITVKGLMLHSVGCNQPKASVFINSWNSPSYDNACVHGFIDANDGTVYQTLPWNHRGWHCGSGSKGSGNNTHIGVEMCEPACIKYTGGSSFTCSDLATARACAERTYQAVVELFAMLCKQYSLNPLADGVVISHKEGHARGIASNHGTRNSLNPAGMGYTMDTFGKRSGDNGRKSFCYTSGYTKIMGTAVPR
ncbi:MAG: N-acetylmuramoyl-L-alanine amidase family protein [Merdimonas faecis]|uniref:peptidoglycan recognition protein family protein n=1 Tax=Merdimonas faecis TaxID=1653435 RepID=UPI003990B672